MSGKGKENEKGKLVEDDTQKTEMGRKEDEENRRGGQNKRKKRNRRGT